MLILICTLTVLAIPATIMAEIADSQRPVYKIGVRSGYSIAIASLLVCYQEWLVEAIRVAFPDCRLAVVILMLAIAIVSYIIYVVLDKIGDFTAHIMGEQKRKTARKKALRQVLSKN